jgi:hypothetical protein
LSGNRPIAESRESSNRLKVSFPSPSKESGRRVPEVDPFV